MFLLFDSRWLFKNAVLSWGLFFKRFLYISRGLTRWDAPICHPFVRTLCSIFGIFISNRICLCLLPYHIHNIQRVLFLVLLILILRFHIRILLIEYFFIVFVHILGFIFHYLWHLSCLSVSYRTTQTRWIASTRQTQFFKFTHSIIGIYKLFRLLYISCDAVAELFDIFVFFFIIWCYRIIVVPVLHHFVMNWLWLVVWLNSSAKRRSINCIFGLQRISVWKL